MPAPAPKQVPITRRSILTVTLTSRLRTQCFAPKGYQLNKPCRDEASRQQAERVYCASEIYDNGTTTEERMQSGCRVVHYKGVSQGYPDNPTPTDLRGLRNACDCAEKNKLSTRHESKEYWLLTTQKKTSLDHISVFQKKLVVPVLVGTQRFWVRTHLDSRPAIVLSPSASRAASLSHSARTSTPRRRKLLAARVERSRGHQRGKLRVVRGPDRVAALAPGSTILGSSGSGSPCFERSR